MESNNKGGKSKCKNVGSCKRIKSLNSANAVAGCEQSDSIVPTKNPESAQVLYVMPNFSSTLSEQDVFYDCISDTESIRHVSCPINCQKVSREKHPPLRVAVENTKYTNPQLQSGTNGVEIPIQGCEANLEITARLINDTGAQSAALHCDPYKLLINPVTISIPLKVDVQTPHPGVNLEPIRTATVGASRPLYLPPVQGPPPGDLQSEDTPSRVDTFRHFKNINFDPSSTSTKVEPNAIISQSSQLSNMVLKSVPNKLNYQNDKISQTNIPHLQEKLREKKLSEEEIIEKNESIKSLNPTEKKSQTEMSYLKEQQMKKIRAQEASRQNEQSQTEFDLEQENNQVLEEDLELETGIIRSSEEYAGPDTPKETKSPNMNYPSQYRHMKGRDSDDNENSTLLKKDAAQQTSSELNSDAFNKHRCTCRKQRQTTESEIDTKKECKCSKITKAITMNEIDIRKNKLVLSNNKLTETVDAELHEQVFNIKSCELSKKKYSSEIYCKCGCTKSSGIDHTKYQSPSDICPCKVTERTQIHRQSEHSNGVYCKCGIPEPQTIPQLPSGTCSCRNMERNQQTEQHSDIYCMCGMPGCSQGVLGSCPCQKINSSQIMETSQILEWLPSNKCSCIQSELRRVSIGEKNEEYFSCRGSSADNYTDACTINKLLLDTTNNSCYCSADTITCLEDIAMACNIDSDEYEIENEDEENDGDFDRDEEEVEEEGDDSPEFKSCYCSRESLSCANDQTRSCTQYCRTISDPIDRITRMLINIMETAGKEDREHTSRREMIIILFGEIFDILNEANCGIEPLTDFIEIDDTNYLRDIDDFDQQRNPCITKMEAAIDECLFKNLYIPPSTKKDIKLQPEKIELYSVEIDPNFKLAKFDKVIEIDTKSEDEIEGDDIDLEAEIVELDTNMYINDDFGGSCECSINSGDTEITKQNEHIKQKAQDEETEQIEQSELNITEIEESEHHDQYEHIEQEQQNEQSVYYEQNKHIESSEHRETSELNETNKYIETYEHDEQNEPTEQTEVYVDEFIGDCECTQEQEIGEMDFVLIEQECEMYTTIGTVSTGMGEGDMDESSIIHKSGKKDKKKCDCCHCRAKREEDICLTVDNAKRTLDCDPVSELRYFIDSIILDMDAMNYVLQCKNQQRKETIIPKIGPKENESYPVTIVDVTDLNSSSLYIKWEIQNCYNIAGYEIYVDGRLKNRYYNFRHEAAVICDVDTSQFHKIVLRAEPISEKPSGDRDTCLCGDIVKKTAITQMLIDPVPTANGWYPSIYLYDPTKEC